MGIHSSIRAIYCFLHLFYCGSQPGANAGSPSLEPFQGSLAQQVLGPGSGLVMEKACQLNSIVPTMSQQSKAQCSDSLVLPHGRYEDDERAAPLSSQCSTEVFPGQGGKSHVGNPSESDEGRPSAKQNAAPATNVPGLSDAKGLLADSRTHDLTGKAVTPRGCFTEAPQGIKRFVKRYKKHRHCHDVL